MIKTALGDFQHIFTEVDFKLIILGTKSVLKFARIEKNKYENTFLHKHLQTMVKIEKNLQDLL